MVDLNEMRVVLGQQNAAFNQAMANALGSFTAPKDGYSKEKQRLLQNMNAEKWGDACLKQADDIYCYGSSRSGAALVVELCKGFGAARPPKGYLLKLQQWAKEKGMLFVVDEIQTGMGRTGSIFLYEQEGLDPDMLLLGKALGNGLHIAALLVKDVPALSGGSGDDPLACAAACEVFRQLEDGLLDHVKSVGNALCEGLSALSHHDCVCECCGVGLMAAVEFTSAEVCARVAAKVRAAGYLPGCTGNILYCKPLYVITMEHVQGFLKALGKALEQEN